MSINKKPNIAIVAGGYSGEYSVSLRSAAGLLSWIDRELFTPYLVRVERDGWWVDMAEGVSHKLSLDDFGFDLQGERITLDYALITIHGAPGEDGLLQGYLDMKGIPYNTGGVLTESLTFNKYFCNRYLSTYEGVRVAQSLRLLREQAIPKSEHIVEQLGLPLFVKPNTGGSSVATSRVEGIEELEQAIQTAFAESREVLLERFISGTEVTCGCYQVGGATKALPVTEVVTHNRFFDFDAKYNGQVEEITPARISDELTRRIQALTEAIYGYVDARGIIRVDYIIEQDGLPTLLEVNTTPGMTPTSFIPQQIAVAGLEIGAVLTDIIQAGLQDKH